MRGLILLSLEFEHIEQIIETHDLFILGLLFLRKRPSGTLSRQLCHPSRQVFFTAWKAASNLSNVCFSIPTLHIEKKSIRGPRSRHSRHDNSPPDLAAAPQIRTKSGLPMLNSSGPSHNRLWLFLLRFF